jgi:hypothetical protein
MKIDSVKGVVTSALQRASAATGVDFGYLVKTAARESANNPLARAGTSSAAGLFQFVDQTWMATLKQYGAKHGYGGFADLIEKGSDGRFRVDNAGARRAVMNLKLDPQASALMAGELTADHADYLRARVGREPTGGELYIAHFLGPQGSARLIEAARSQPGASAASLFPDAASANRSIFYSQGRANSVAEVYANLTRSGPQALPQTPAQTEPTGYLQYVSSRSEDRRANQRALIEMILGDLSPASGPVSGQGAGLGTGLEGGFGNKASFGSAFFNAEVLKLLSEARAKAQAQAQAQAKGGPGKTMGPDSV